jgi:RNA-directed DNA polymerase
LVRHATCGKCRPAKREHLSRLAPKSTLGLHFGSRFQPCCGLRENLQANPLGVDLKRIGGLFWQYATPFALYAAYEKAREGKRNHRGCFEFERNIGGNIDKLLVELQSGTYKPTPLNTFWVKDGAKPRLIEAPSFRDLVVQHAIYRVISPIVETRYIATNFACRVGKGTHAASDWLYSVMRKAPPTSWVLHVDVRKFFYSIDRDILMGMMRRMFKCDQTLNLLKMFSIRPHLKGVPIGNLMSQTFANVFLNSLDHFCKRVLKIRHYGRYMDDSIMIAPDRLTGLQWLEKIRAHLLSIGLEISHYSLQPMDRGVDFVGYRTWAKKRLVRPGLITAIRRDCKRGKIESIVSRLGHARRTNSLASITNFLKENHHDLFDRLPQAYRRHSHP